MERQGFGRPSHRRNYGVGQGKHVSVVTYFENKIRLLYLLSSCNDPLTHIHQLSVDDFPERRVPLKLTMLDRECKKVAEMTTTYPSWLLASERVQEVLPVAAQPGVCEYRTWYTLEGVGAYYILLTAQEELHGTQTRCADALKAFVENGK